LDFRVDNSNIETHNQLAIFFFGQKYYLSDKKKTRPSISQKQSAAFSKTIQNKIYHTQYRRLGIQNIPPMNTEQKLSGQC